MAGRPDFTELAGECGCDEDRVRERAIELGAWWFIVIDPDRIVAGDKAIRAGMGPGAVARAMGTDVHTALILMGLRSGYGEG